MHKRNILIKLIPVLGICVSNSVYAQVAALPNPYTAASGNFVRTWIVTSPQTDPNALPTGQLRDVKQTTSYFDGLGRPLQTVAMQGSLATGGTATDMVSSNLYDTYGREPLKYLPFAANNTGGNTSLTDGNFKLNPFQEQAAFLLSSNTSSPITGQNETYFYGKTNFEASPLNRPKESYAPGDNWVGTEGGTKNGTKINYYVNTATDAVRIWNVTVGATGSFSSYSSLGAYPAGALYKTITSDEKNNQVIEFKDKEGKVILKKVQLTALADDGTTGSDHTGWLCTYYLYDDLNNLHCVIQPNGVQLISSAWVLTDVTILAEQCFRYEYDQRNRMIIKKVPGAGEVWMVYDGLDRLVMTQDANMRSANVMQWMYTKYDGLNRPVSTGRITDNTNYNSLTYHLGLAYLSTNYPDLSLYAGYETLTTTHYDDYLGLSAGLTASLYASGYATYLTASATTPDYAEPTTQSLAARGMPTWTSVEVIGSASQFISTVNIYDLKGRVLQTQSINVNGKLDVVTNQYSFSNQVLRSHINHKYASQSYDVGTHNIYDDLGRVTGVEKNLNNGGWKAINAITYDALGQLKTKKLSPAFNGSAGLENLTYDYNIRGWMLGANRDFVRDANSTNYFGFDLGYDKANNNLINNQTYANPQFNGNIEGTVWKSRGDGEKRKYDFTYDAANRLLKADFNQYTGTTFNKTANVNFSTQMGDGINATSAYDANGNIIGITQSGLKIGGSVVIDQLTYSYQTNSNKLLRVTDGIVTADNGKLGDFKDGTNTGTDDYSYDANGNLSLDNNKAISSISYNHLNLPWVITVAGKGTITYLYDAAGNKLQKQTLESAATVNVSGTNYSTSITTTTVYVAGVVYESKSYGNATVNTALGNADVLQFIPQEEGRIRKKTDGTFAYDYFIKDHLGNTRMVLTEDLTSDTYPNLSFEGTAGTVEVNNQNAIWEKADGTAFDVVGMRTTIPQLVNATTLVPATLTYSLLVRNSTGKVGAGKLLKVMSGDKINTTVQYYFSQNTEPGTATSLNTLVSALTNVLVNSASTTAAFKASPSAITTPLSIDPNATGFFTPQSGTTNNGRPKAFLNVLFFDEQFKFDNTSSYSEQIGTANPGQIVIALGSAKQATKNGYCYIYISNETNDPVYFDNFTLKHERGQILEETHYYPFGLTMSGISSKAAGKLENRRKFNDGTELNTDFDINLYETDFRSYDPQIGRFHQIDELADFNFDYSTYAFANDNPILMNDPLGLEAEIAIVSKPKEVSTKDKPKDLGGVTVVGVRHKPSTAAKIVDGVTDFIPFIGPSKDIYKGIRDGNPWEFAGGVAGLTFDFFTFGSGSIAKGAAKTLLKEGAEEFAKLEAKNLTGGIIQKEASNLILNEGINVTEEGFTHVMKRHYLEGFFPKKSKFTMGVREIVGLIKNSAQVPKRILTNSGNFERVIDAGRVVGIDGFTQQPTTMMTIITNAAGDLQSAFPGVLK